MKPESKIAWQRPCVGGNCVEAADLPDGRVGVRHSQDPDGLVLRFTSAEWHAFLGGVRAGKFDGLGHVKREP